MLRLRLHKCRHPHPPAPPDPQKWDTIVVKAQKLSDIIGDYTSSPPPPPGGTGVGLAGAGLAGGASGAGTNIRLEDFFANLIKSSKAFCIKASEACVGDPLGWSTRLTNGVCKTYAGSQGACNTAVAYEALINNCTNTNAC